MVPIPILALVGFVWLLVGLSTIVGRWQVEQGASPSDTRRVRDALIGMAVLLSFLTVPSVWALTIARYGMAVAVTVIWLFASPAIARVTGRRKRTRE